MTQIIAFTGLKQTGKTTAADYLVSKYGFVKHNFKDSLVEEIKERFPDLLEEMVKTYWPHIEDEENPIEDLFIHKPPLIRTLLQNYGTEVRRADKESYWTDQWEGKLVFALNEDSVVVDDCRFISESEVIRKHGGTIIRLTRPDLTTPDNHSSETEQSQIGVDYTIETEQGDFEGLYRELDRVVANLSP